PAPAEEPPAPAEEAPASPPAEAPAAEGQSSVEGSGYRRWTDGTGRYTIVAKYVTTLESGVVRLRKPNGRYVRVAFDRLSEADQGYVRARQAALVMR
ncbi:MAG TPA: hypothetical protein EYP56_17205, partial [Planctomycetaceae bacterium]|nr:hypothetical protein [Planctomycetaceae bacterium]